MFITEDGTPQWQQRYSMRSTSEKIIGISIAVSGALIVFIAALAAIDVVCCDGTLHFDAWGTGARMAIPTSVCLMLVGSALILTSGILKSIARRR